MRTRRQLLAEAGSPEHPSTLLREARCTIMQSALAGGRRGRGPGPPRWQPAFLMAFMSGGDALADSCLELPGAVREGWPSQALGAGRGCSLAPQHPPGPCQVHPSPQEALSASTLPARKTLIPGSLLDLLRGPRGWTLARTMVS